MNSTQLMSMSECLAIWGQKSTIELADLAFPKKRNRRVKIGRDEKGNLITVGFKYLKNDEIEIYSASRINSYMSSHI